MSLNKYSFELNNNDMGDTDFGSVVVYKHDLPYVPTPRLYENKKALTDGSIVQGVSYDAFTVTLHCACFYDASSRSDVLEEIAEAIEECIGTDVSFRAGWRPDKVYTVRVASPFKPDEKLNGALFTLSLHVANPIPEDVEEE